MNLSFKTAKELRSRIESLPKGPLWKSTTWKTPYPTKKPLTLYYRDPIECLQSLMSNPLLKGSIDFTPFKLWKTAERVVRVYNEWLSGDAAWKIQVRSYFYSRTAPPHLGFRISCLRAPLSWELSYRRIKHNFQQ